MTRAQHASEDFGQRGVLLLQDICADLVRFLHGADSFDAVVIDRDYPLGAPGAFADIRVSPAGADPYFIEVEYGREAETLIEDVARKYGALADDAWPVQRLVLVIDTGRFADWPALHASLRKSVEPAFTLEIWDEAHLRKLTEACFGESIPEFALTGPEMLDIRRRLEIGKERMVFGAAPPANSLEAVLRQNLLWHFGTWRMRELRQTRHDAKVTDLVPERTYEDVVVVMADLSSFSSYMRDTPSDTVIRDVLTSFYTKARHQVISAGGMALGFVGDEIVALFGIPDRRAGYVDAALRTAFRLLDIGASVAQSWQARIDHVQHACGAHVSLAMGTVQLVPLRVFDLGRLTALADSIDIAARLLNVAQVNQVVVSNVLRHAVRASTYECVALPPLAAHNMGDLQPWLVSRAAR